MSEDKDSTPTSLLMDCLEDFGVSEPTHVIVIYINEAGDLCWRSTSTSFTQKIGMLELTRYFMLNGMIERK